MGQISAKRILIAPALLAATTIALAAAIASVTGVDGSPAFAPYLGAWASLTLLSLLVWIFVQVAMMARVRADRPLRKVALDLKVRWPQALLPALIFPLFLGSYTWAKSSIPFAVGYRWEEFWADADRLIFGNDAWRLAHASFPPSLARAWTFFYSVIWGFALAVSGTLVAAFAGRRFTATFFTAMMLSWLIGGIIIAYAISAAGPVFAHLADPELAAQFQPLRAELARILAKDDLVLLSQRYLEVGASVKVAVKGGGISAMPSMHIATATIFIIAAWRTRWLLLAVLFWMLTFLGSVYLGYHYAVDAPVAAVVAVLCWATARRIYREPAGMAGRLDAGEPISLAQQPAAQ